MISVQKALQAHTDGQPSMHSLAASRHTISNHIGKGTLKRSIVHHCYLRKHTLSTERQTSQDKFIVQWELTLLAMILRCGHCGGKKEGHFGCNTDPQSSKCKHTSHSCFVVCKLPPTLKPAAQTSWCDIDCFQMPMKKATILSTTNAQNRMVMRNAFSIVGLSQSNWLHWQVFLAQTNQSMKGMTGLLCIAQGSSGAANDVAKNLWKQAGVCPILSFVNLTFLLTHPMPSLKKYFFRINLNVFLCVLEQVNQLLLALPTLCKWLCLHQMQKKNELHYSQPRLSLFVCDQSDDIDADNSAHAVCVKM